VDTMEAFTRTHFIGKVQILHVCIRDSYLMLILQERDLLVIRLCFQDLASKNTKALIQVNRNTVVQFVA
jgi:hypothetical protein